MENIDPAAAREALADIERTKEQLRRMPWPWWLLVGNPVLFGTWALLPLFTGGSPAVPVVMAIAIIGFNTAAGYRIGAPWVTGKGYFVVPIALMGLCVMASQTMANVAVDRWGAPLVWLHVVLAVAAVLLGLAAAGVHARGATR